MAFSAVDHSATPLAEIGVDEVEPGVCDDSYENRRLLRSNKFTWDQVTDEQGEQIGLIRAFNEEETTARRGSVWERRKPILSDPDNPWSDYVSALEYPVDFPAPTWIWKLIRSHERLLREGADTTRALLPTRCDMVRIDGTRCWNWTARRDDIQRCRSHLNWDAKVDQSRVHVARIKIAQASIRAAEALEYLSESANGEAVMLKASTEILDRAGVRGGVEIDHNVHVDETDPSAVIRDRLAQLAERQEQARLASEQRERARLEIESADVVEGEVISDSE